MNDIPRSIVYDHCDGSTFKFNANKCGFILQRKSVIAKLRIKVVIQARTKIYFTFMMVVLSFWKIICTFFNGNHYNGDIM